MLPGGSRLALATLCLAGLWYILLSFPVCNIVGLFLRKLSHEVDDPDNSPGQQAGKPEIAPETPGEKEFVQEGARKNQWEADYANDGKPTKKAIEHILDNWLIFNKTLATLYRIVKRN